MKYLIAISHLSNTYEICDIYKSLSKAEKSFDKLVENASKSNVILEVCLIESDLKNYFYIKERRRINYDK